MSRPAGPATTNTGAATRLRPPSKVAASLASAEPLSFPVVSVKANSSASAVAATAASTRRPSSTATAASMTSSKAARKPSTVSAASAPVVRKESIIDNHSAKRKRPAWDVKGRLEDMEEYSKATTSKLSDSKNLIQGLTSKLNDGQEQINELLQFKLHLESQFHSKQMENTEMNGQLKHLETELENAKQKHTLEICALTSQHAQQLTESAAREHTLQATVATLTSTAASLKAETDALKASLSTQSTALVTLRSDLSVSRCKVDALAAQLAERESAICDLMKELGSERARGVELDAKLRDEESVRRRLHNEIQELKGNIRVFCRIRPLLENEQDSAPLTHIKLNPADDKSLELVATAAAETVRDVQSSTTAVAKSYPFSFDKIFPAHASQAHVFEEIAQLVQSALDGYNVCIFAYGQTGSGKTFTMEGGKTPDQIGVIPRAVSQIFAASALLAQKGWSYTFEASFLEIYNETIRDLLLVTNGSKAGNTAQQQAKYEIKHEGGLTRVTDLTVCPVSTGDEVHSFLRRASSNRAVAATNSNEHSSRSHSVFTLRLAGLNALTQERCAGALNLIDLAGSERLSVSGSTGDRLKETQAINKSLSALGDVIFALGNKEGHVPYRNSKLTYLLQNSLGGNSKTLMFVNVSPLAASFGESLCSLRFATKVNSCQIGTAKALKK